MPLDPFNFSSLSNSKHTPPSLYQRGESQHLWGGRRNVGCSGVLHRRSHLDLSTIYPTLKDIGYYNSWPFLGLVSLVEVSLSKMTLAYIKLT